MNFLDALRLGRPMRREIWTKHPPVRELDENIMRMVVDSMWVYLRPIADGNESRWIYLQTGKPIQLNSADYLADDWSVL